MKRFEFEVVATIRKRGKIQVDAPNETLAYEVLMDNLDSYEDDIESFDTHEVDMEVDACEIIEEE